MNSLIVEVNSDKYLIRYKVLKSVVNRKHTTKEGKVINRNELHPTSVVVYLYKINNLHGIEVDVSEFTSLKDIQLKTRLGYLSYLGRGLSKCSDKDKFDKNKGIRIAIANIDNLDAAHDINFRILNTKL